MDENALITAARQGDQAAFSALYALHADYVRAIARSVLHHTDLEDICQDIFMLAFCRLDRFAGASSFRTWITRITINQCLMAVRKAKQPMNGDSLLIQIDEVNAVDPSPDAWRFASFDKTLEGVPARMEMEALLHQLRPAHRRMLEMAYLDDMPDQEIAETLGLQLSTVKNILYRAKRRFRTLYARQSDFLDTSAS